MRAVQAAADGRTAAIVVHGHRDGHACAGHPWISAECMARVRAAGRVAELATASGATADVLLCGAGAPGFPSEARQMADHWNGPPARLWLDEDSTDTAENASNALAWALLVGARDVTVVSSWWHVRLRMYYRPFRLIGISVCHVGAPAVGHSARHLAHELRYLPLALRRAARCGEALRDPADRRLAMALQSRMGIVGRA